MANWSLPVCHTRKGKQFRSLSFCNPLPRARLTVGHLRRSGLIGMWQARGDIGDSYIPGMRTAQPYAKDK
jgi:hypothetical protein